MLDLTKMRDVMRAPAILLYFVTLLLLQPVSAGVYKWVDDNGRVHYGDRPPEPAAEQLQLQPATVPPKPSPSEDARRKAQQRLLDVYREERQQKQADADRHRRQKTERKEKCQQAQQRFARFNNASGIYEKDTEGEREYLDPGAREQFMQELRAEVQHWCGRD